MARHRTEVRYFAEPSPGWSRRYRCEFGEIVGARVRRLRQARDMKIYELASLLPRPGGGTYSASFVSKLERGFASPPLWVYVLIAERFEVPAGKLLGEEGFEREVDEAELALVRALRRLGVTPDEAIARLLRSPLDPDPEVAVLAQGE